MNEIKAFSLPGVPVAALCVLVLVGCAALFLYGAAHNLLPAIVMAAVAFAIVAFLCKGFCHIRGESAPRQMAQSYPYDSHDHGKPSLRSHGDEITAHLRGRIQERLGKAGVKVLEARISHLAYAQEIAQAILQRQQAGAIIAARTKIIEGAFSMVQTALQRLSQRHIVDLDEERRAARVFNLLVAPCGERGTQPVLNTVALYQG